VISSNLVVVLAFGAVVPFVYTMTGKLRLPGPVLEMLAGILIGPAALGWARPDELVNTLGTLGLSFLLFLAGFEVDVRRFRTRIGPKVMMSLLISMLLSAATMVTMDARIGQGSLLVGIALLATSLGVVVPVLADAAVARQPVGVITVSCASAGEVAAVVAFSLGVAGSPTPLIGRLLLLGLLLTLVGGVGTVLAGARHASRIVFLIQRLADTSAQIRIRLTVLVVTGIAFAAARLGFESILGAFLAGVLVRTVDPEPQRAHPLYRIKIEAIAFGLLVPVYFIRSGMALDVEGLTQQPATLAEMALFLAALLAVRGLPVVVFWQELSKTQLLASALLQATSLPFLLTAAQVGLQMGLLSRSTSTAIAGAGMLSVLTFPPIALRLLALPQSGPRRRRLRRRPGSPDQNRPP